MKRKIIFGLTLYTVVFLLAGVYVAYTIRSASNDLDRLITLHQVEILREHYLLQVKKVQTNLTLRDTSYSRSFDTVVTDVRNMGRIVDACFDCHHSARGTERLKELKEETERYKDALSRVITVRANGSRLASEKDMAFRIGERLIGKTQEMISFTTSKLGEHTQKAMTRIDQVKYILYGLVAIAPLVSALLAFIFISGLTRPVRVLVESTRKLKSGDMDHRVENLRDEFGELASSFNEMSGALKEKMRQMREAEQTLEKANRELKLAQEQMVKAETMAAIGTLSTGISHELTTPLSVILNMTQLTKQDSGMHPSLLKDLEVIEYEANQAIKITRSLLGFARSTKSKKEAVNVNRILEDLFKILEFQPAAKSIKLVRELDPDLNAINANSGQIRQVFLNIILNAVQAMGASGELRVGTRNCSDDLAHGVEVAIADTGGGIPPDQVKQIFQPFFTTKEDGTGLGLAISYGIIQEHNGRIAVESSVGNGTTFRIYIPRGNDPSGEA
jgi:two-component system NtrC family sensor kinase